MSLKTKVSIGFLIGVYFFSHSFTQWIFGFTGTVSAADETPEQIIAVFVDKGIYERHNEDINRYAQDYLQKQSANTKALVLPMNKDSFQATDIWKILENLYQEGMKEKKSTLVGTILIGEMPLPVIKENNYVYPSIYPYTDIEKPSYVYDPASSYFIPHEKGDKKADIWQSVINFEQRDEEYTKFFTKLRSYDNNPTNYTSTKIWYDDFIGLKKYYSDQFLSGYINNFLFHEDITYHRFTNLILDYFKDGANSSAVSLISNYTQNVGPTADDDYSQLGEVGEEYTSAISSWKNNLKNMAQDANTDLNAVGNDSNRIPTLMIGQSLSSLIQPYTNLFAPEFLTNISTNIAAGGRWKDEDVDSHIKKTVLKDNLTTAVLLDANTVLENSLYNKLKDDKYALRIPIPLVYEDYQCLPGPIKRIRGRYENFYFGRSAYDVESTQDISIYPGTYKNIGSRQDLTTYNYATQGEQDDINIDYTVRSVGASYGIASRQVESSRGYNTLLVPKDQKFYDERKCKSSQEIDDFVSKYWGGISPLNVDGDTMLLKENNPKMAWNPRFDTTIGGPVFDIAGSKMTLTKMNNNLFFLEELNNSMLHRTQQFRLAPWLVCGKTVPAGEVNENWYNGYPNKQPSEVEYFSRYASDPSTVHLTNNNQNTSPHECGDNYVYKTIDTLETHTSPTPDQIKGMSPLTQDRPIDSARFVAFKGIGGGAVKIDYPNIYNVSVFKKDGTTMTLKNPQEITEAIKTYLRDKVKGLNLKLSEENNNQSLYYISKSAAFDKLATVDTLATPKNRTYNLLTEDFFINALGEETIKEVANILYWQNLGWYNKAASPDLLTDLNNNQTSLDINKKIGYVTENYLTKNENPSTAVVPGYEPKGYELVYINSDGNDILKNTSAPDIINNIQQLKLASSSATSNSATAANAGLEMVEAQKNEKCGIAKDATVPLLKWPKALSCWMQGLKETTVSDVIKINFKNAQGPVLSLDQFKDTATVWTDNIERFSDQWKSILGKDDNLSNEAQELIQVLDNQLSIRLNKASISMDERDDISLTLASREDLGNLNIRISGTGDNCPTIEGRNLCSSEYAFQKNLYDAPSSLKVGLATTKLGSSIINVKVCQNVRCVEREIIVPLIAGAMTSLAIVTPTDKVLYGSQVPVKVLGYDTYGNAIEQTTTTYRLTSSVGTIIANGNNTDSVELQSFDPNQEYFADLTSVNAGATITLSAEPINAATGTVAPRATKTLTLTQGTLTAKYNTQTATSIDINLPDDTSSYFTLQNGVAQLQESALPRLTFTLTSPDGKPLDSAGVIRSTQGLLKPGTSAQNTYNLSGNMVTAKEFIEQGSFSIKGGVATVILYPTFQAGTDTLTIEVPGVPLKTITVNVNAASPYRVAIQSADSTLPERNTTGEVIVYDRWDNPITSAANVKIQTIGDLKLNGSTNTTVATQNGRASFNLESGKIGGTHYIYATLEGIDPSKQLPDSKTITVLAQLWKSSNMNALYMLLGGNDWGNKWGYFTEQANEADNVLTSSQKVLAVTTLLTNPDHIRPAVLRISQNGQIYDSSTIRMSIRNGSLSYDLGKKGYISLGSLNLTQGKANDGVANNTIVYTPEPTDSITTSNEVRGQNIVVNGTAIWSTSDASINAAEVTSTNQYDNNRDLIWEVKLQGKRVGTLRVHANIDEASMHLHDSVGAEQTWLGGSTNSPRGWMVYENNGAPLSAQISWAGGYEDSRDSDTNTSWKNTFHAANAFSQGDKVGAATKHGASPFMITFGDPLLSRQSANDTVEGTTHDAGQGKTIFTETDKSINKTMPFDLDRDGQKDLLVIYTDGSVRILKNSGGSNPYKDLGMLMVIADGIKDVYVGDTDGNSYEDILIQTNEDKLRVYKNIEGKMDVDGRQLCIAIPGGNENVKNTHEMFVHDMDNDGNLDIVTNDTLGNISLFYGGSSSAGDNYISTEISRCDDNWQERQKDHMLLIKSYGVTLTPGQKVYDNSLLHWKGLTMPAEMDPNNDDEEMPMASDPQFQNLLKGKDSDFSSLDVTSIVNSGLPEVIQYTASPISTLPSYETAITTENIAYIPMHMLDNNSAVSAYKEFSTKSSGMLKNGDQIEVKITLTAKRSSTFSYLDEVKGPWEMKLNDDGSIDTWNRGNLPSSAQVNWTVSNGYAYMVDNISLTTGQSVTFGYTLNYVSPKTVSIALEDINTDTYQDIKTYSTDSCQKGYWTFKSDEGEAFEEGYINLETDIATVQKEAEDNVKELLNEVQGKIKEAADSDDPQVTEMPGMDQVLENWEQGNTLIQNGNLSINLNNQALSDLTDSVEQTVDTAIKGLCEGFKLGKGGATSGPPVPFNMAFLSPGTYNIFGCKLMQDKGLPAFFFPGTIYAGPYTVPFPYGQKGSTDGFYWAAGGVYPSMIRIYVSPTLTMGIGIGICFGPYTVGAKIPSPFRHIAGNCIVLAKNFGKNKNNTPQPSQPTIPSWQYNLAQGGACNRPTQDPQKPSSPFKMNASSAVPGSSAPPGGGYAGGLIYFDQEPRAVSVGMPSVGSETLKGGQSIKLKIEGGNVKGLVKCIVQKWMDNQIRYIINNLTNLSVNIYLPDLSTLFEGFDNLSLDKLGSIYDDTKAQTDPSPSARQGVVQSLFSKEGMRQNSDAVSNPFDALSSLFENVPLINVNTQNVNIQVPFIAQEDVTKYKAYLGDWLQRNEKVLQEWNMAAQNLEGTCASYKSAFEQNACKEKLKGIIDISDKSAQVVRALKQNVNTLEQYRKFPIELNKWLSVSQRYLTEVADTVTVFTYSITNWLQINARRFEQYVDAIILLISAVKTWQVLIDFSVNWKTKCGKCKVDNYDFYSCTLSLLCINLPILPIPKFRIPSINIDLSNINLGMDILLPKFNFVPKNVPLPRLPDLPAPPSIDIDFDLNVAIPQIPVLPAPPTLPELPSFIPNIELNLPTLPPAPRIPKIAPQITQTLKVAEFIAKIFCIVKGGIGLVAEKGVKTRIEQMTQRSWSVQPFDSLSITKITPPLKGFDINIDTYINMQLNFDQVYDLIDGFAQKINENTNNVFDTVVTENIGTVSEGSNEIENTLQNGMDKGNLNLQGYAWPNRWDLAYDDTDDGRLDLLTQIHALKDVESSTTRKAKLNQIIAFMNTPAEAGVNIEGIDAVRDQAHGIIEEKKDEISDIQYKILNEYDSFVKSLQTTLVSDNTDNSSLGTALFTANKTIIDTVKSEPNPTESYLNLNKTVMDGFSKALDTHSAEELNMSLLTYNETKNYVHQTRDAVNEGLDILAANDSKSTNNSEPVLLAASAGGGGHSHGGSSSASAQADISQYIKGIFVKDTNGDMVSVVNRDDIIDTLQENQTRADYNGDGDEDIMMWDQKQIWIKYAHPEKTPPVMKFTRLYRTPIFDSPRELIDEVQKGGWINVAGTTFKIWDTNTAPQGFSVEGQSFDSIVLQWDNNHTDGYLVQMTDKVVNRRDMILNRNNVQYVLVLASGTTTDGLFLTTDILGGQKRVNDLVRDKSIIDVIYYDTTDESIGLTLTNLPRQWQYLSATKLSRKNINRNAVLLEKSSPWSHQEVAGIQIAGDNMGPVANVKMIRKQNNELAGEGFRLQPIVGNKYSLVIEWEDDSGVKENTVLFANGNSQTSQGNTTTINDLTYKTDSDSMTIRAQDQNGNVAEYPINIQWAKPEIAISNVDRPTDTTSVIDTEISQGLDAGKVIFERERNGVWTLMTGTSVSKSLLSLFPLNFNQQSLSGGTFAKNDLLALYNSAGSRIGTVDKQSGEIAIDDTYKATIDIEIVFTTNTPKILVKEKATSKVLFSVALQGKTALNTTISDDTTWQQRKLDDGYGQTFTNGTCIADKDNKCHIYIGTQGAIWLPDTDKNDFVGTYSYKDKVITITIFDRSGNEVATTQFIPQPLSN